MKREPNDNPDVEALARILAARGWPTGSNPALRRLERRLWELEAKTETEEDR
jgi:hypothetical protein